MYIVGFYFNLFVDENFFLEVGGGGVYDFFLIIRGIIYKVFWVEVGFEGDFDF